MTNLAIQIAIKSMQAAGYWDAVNQLGGKVTYQGRTMLLRTIRWNPAAKDHKEALLIDPESGNRVITTLDDIAITRSERED